MGEPTQCRCMDGPNYPDPSCLYCGGTGDWVSDERLAELVERKASDRQHVAIFTALQIARAQAPGKRRLTVWADVSRDDYPPGELVWHCNELGSRDGYHDENVIELAAASFPDGTVLHVWEPSDK